MTTNQPHTPDTVQRGAMRADAVRDAAEAFQMRDLDNARIWSTVQVAEILHRIADDMEGDDE